MRNNTSNVDATEIRWEVLKSMLDNFPELQNRIEQYLFNKRPSPDTHCSEHADSNVRELTQRAVREYRKSSLRK